MSTSWVSASADASLTSSTKHSLGRTSQGKYNLSAYSQTACLPTLRQLACLLSTDSLPAYPQRVVRARLAARSPPENLPLGLRVRHECFLIARRSSLARPGLVAQVSRRGHRGTAGCGSAGSGRTSLEPAAGDRDARARGCGMPVTPFTHVFVYFHFSSKYPAKDRTKPEVNRSSNFQSA